MNNDWFLAELINNNNYYSAIIRKKAFDFYLPDLFGLEKSTKLEIAMDTPCYPLYSTPNSKDNHWCDVCCI